MRILSLRRFVFCALFVATPLVAQDLALFPTFGLSGAGYLGNFGTKLRVDPHVEGIQGTTLDLEKDLGLDGSKTMSRVGFEWRPLRKHELGVSFFKARREGLRVIERQIVFEDTTFPIRADIQSKFNLDVWDATYTYWWQQSPRHGLGINLGVAGLAVKGELSARTTAGGGFSLSESASTEFPIPVIGLDGRFLLTDRVIGSARGSILPHVKFKDYSGDAWVGRVALEYRPYDSVGVGVGYNYFNLNGTIEKSDMRGDVGMTVSGVEGFVHFVFGGR